VGLTACWHGGGVDADHPGRSPFGAITVLSRDHDSGDIVAQADLELRGPAPRKSSSSKYGFATFDKLPPGKYDLIATFAAQPVEIDAIDVSANQTNYVDVAFTLGHPDPIKMTFAETLHGAIDRYHPKGMNQVVGRIEGMLTDGRSHARIEGAVVTAVGGGQVLQAVTDAQGRYHLEDVAPATYALSAVYSLNGRGQIEVRRSEIPVAGGEAVIVPLTIEIDR
jgi:hypothetical protein